ncbi:hypothetical protein [Sphingopyxis sp. JAI108]|uniref:hypothetical protein n=1 Tax=Sphingopyxis sp. JAI108 TaxID=2723060 RepID=UPI0015C9E76F|nr:hypothetical protein [Sphingopyxis sp. JAI108]NYF33099.1 hypothetical protein [Sphingopyxis sp. JAI108]
MHYRFGSKIALIVCAGACVITSPARANSDAKNSDEDALVRDFLLGDMTAWKFSSFCFNTTLRGLDAKTMEWQQKLPGPDRRSDEERKYLKDLKSVSAEMAPLPTRVVSAEGLDAGRFSVRTAKIEDCQASATFRLYRVVKKNGKAFLSGVLATPCAGVPFGISFRKRGARWERLHTAYYYSAMGPPGCGYISKAVPGDPTDSLIILEKKPPV